MKVTYYQGGYLPAAPAQNRAEEWTATTYTRWNAAGVVQETRPLNAAELAQEAVQAAEATAAANELDLRTKAQQALATNDAFLAIASPTNAQVVTQVQRLTRENSALIRLVLRTLDSTSGT
jgi:hypothetical protein